MSALLHTSDLSLQLGKTPILHNIDLSLSSGTFLGILGANGQGKSTLLHALSGSHLPTRSRIYYKNKPLTAWTDPELAKERAVLTQNVVFRTTLSVQHVVMMGRYPHYHPFGQPSEHDWHCVEHVLDALQLRSLMKRNLHTLSGGQQQLVQVARVLVQVWDSTPKAPKLLLLDEPTSNLDIRYQHLLLHCLRTWLPQKGWGIAAVLHDLNLAVQFATQILLLKDGRVHVQGNPQETLTSPHLQTVFGVATTCQYNSITQQPHILIHAALPAHH